MPVITIFSASHCGGVDVSAKVASTLGQAALSEEDLLRSASQQYDVPIEKLKRAMHGPPSVFNKFTHERERNIAYLRAAIAEMLPRDDAVYIGFATHLIPRRVPHVIKVCLVANRDHRIDRAVQAGDITNKEAGKAIAREDTAAAEWTQQLFELGPWDRSLYDIIIPMHATPIDEAVSVICNNAAKPVVQRTPEADQAMEDFVLESRVGIVMAQKGHDVVVTCEAGEITVVINRNVLRLDRLRGELEDLALKVEGVKSATTRVGPKFREPNIYFKLDAEMPSKILLVDDETEFVQTLSERLQSRNLPTAIAYNGKEALTIIENDEPEVVVLDLQMPGIHGIDVLRQAKKGHPNTEVIILTGHGSSKEEELAIELGAFAYLHKPVDIKVLSETMKDAYRKISTARADKESEGNDHQ